MRNHYKIALLWVIFMIGFAVHLLFWIVKTGMHYPDEIFQYIEPAFVKLRGFGWLPWEFNRGVRNWTLIGFYGGWMKVFMFFGAEGYLLHKLISLHNALISLILIPAGYRLGKCFGDELSAWLCAVLFGVFPPVVYFTPHPLSEVPSTILVVWGIVFWIESMESPGKAPQRWKEPFLCGCLLGMAVVARFFSAVFLIVPALYYFIGLFRRKKSFLFFLLGGLLPLLVLGVSDWLTWGTAFHSAIEYFRYNIIEWGNVQHGISPWWQYFKWVGQRLNWALVVFAPLFVAGLWRTRLLVFAYGTAMLVLCLIAHKEERFFLPLWPLVIVTFTSGFAVLNGFLKSDRRWVLASKISAAVLIFLVVNFFSYKGVKKLPFHWLENYFAAQSFVGSIPDSSGCMFHGRLHLSGGSVYLNKNIPMDTFQLRLSRNPLFNYFIFPQKSYETRMAHRKGWKEVKRFGDLIVFKKLPQ